MRKSAKFLSCFFAAILVCCMVASSVSAATGSDILDTFEQIDKRTLNVVFGTQATGNDKTTLSIDDTEHPNTGAGNYRSLKMDVTYKKGNEGWVILRSGVENSRMIDHNVRNSNDASISFYLKASRKMSGTFQLVVKDEPWQALNIPVETEWKKYEFKVKDLKNSSRPGKTIQQLISEKVYNEAYLSHYSFSFNSNDTSRDVSDTLWLDHVIISGTGISEEKSDYKRDLPGTKPPEKPSSDPGGEPSSDPGDKPSSDPGDKPSSDPGDKPSSNPGDKPSSDPGDKPSSNPDDNASSDVPTVSGPDESGSSTVSGDGSQPDTSGDGDPAASGSESSPESGGEADTESDKPADNPGGQSGFPVWGTVAIVAGAVVVLGGGGAAAYFLYFKKRIKR